jgi:drug/metabolite transporter (DMT)-like permease
MTIVRRRAVAALTAAGLLWGTTVPLSKLALQWLAPAWLAFARLGLAAAVLLVMAGRPRLRAAARPAVLAWGALGYGGVLVLQNAGIARTSVTHAALLIGATPVLIAVIATIWRRTVTPPLSWAGFALSLGGVALVAGGPGGGATLAGDGLVLASLLASAAFTVAQGRLLDGQDPVAVTAVQLLAAAAAVLPLALVTAGPAAGPAGPGAVLSVLALALAGTVAPFTLFAYGQSQVAAPVAGAFLNIEPLVGAAAGAVLFGETAGWPLLVGGAAILAGIGLSSLSGPRRPPQDRGPRGRPASGPRGGRAGHAGRRPAVLPPVRADAVRRPPGRVHRGRGGGPARRPGGRRLDRRAAGLAARLRRRAARRR